MKDRDMIASFKCSKHSARYSCKEKGDSRENNGKDRTVIPPSGKRKVGGPASKTKPKVTMRNGIGIDR